MILKELLERSEYTLVQGSEDVEISTLGQGEGLGVVDTVANHCHGLAFALQAAHEVLLVLGKDVALVVADAGLVGPILDGSLLVAAHQIDLNALLAQTVHGLAGVGLELLARLGRQVGRLREVEVGAGDGQRV